ncbi:MAG: dockerin type I domain-containing protein, partial [Planctomycetota bacterium]|nr:dockerin type I domain-containing protein [Planctomycetota bacterium]
QVPWEFLAYQYVGDDGTLSVTLEDTDNRKFVAADAVRLYRVHQPRLDVRSGEVQILNGMQVNFDPTQRGTPVEQTLTLRNTSDQPLSIESVRELPESFELVDFSPRYLAPGESMPLQIKQTAVDVGVFTGTLALATSDPRRPIAKIDLSSEVVSRALVLDDRDERFEKSGLLISLTNSFMDWHDSTIRMVPTPRLPSEGAWVIEGLDAGTYSIGVTWQPMTNSASNIPVIVSGGEEPVIARIDQTTPPAFQAGVYSDRGSDWIDAVVDYEYSGDRPLRIAMGNFGVIGSRVVIDAIRVERTDSDAQLPIGPLHGDSLMVLRHNNVLPADTNIDGEVTPLDALLVINTLGTMDDSSDSLNRDRITLTDVNRDGQVTALDALQVINYMSRQRENGEGEATVSLAWVTEDQVATDIEAEEERWCDAIDESSSNWNEGLGSKKDPVGSFEHFGTPLGPHRPIDADRADEIFGGEQGSTQEEALQIENLDACFNYWG